jgi:hypothetical protein
MNTEEGFINKNKDFEPDHQYILRKNLWSLREAAHYLFNILPGTTEDWQERYYEIIKLNEIIEIDISLSFLHSYEFNFNGKKVEQTVKPKEFVRWAKSKGYEIPTPLKKLLSGKRDESKEEIRIGAILEKLGAVGYDPLKIPFGGKKEIGKYLGKEKPDLFPNEGIFNEAWKKARLKDLVRMENHDDYTKGK